MRYLITLFSILLMSSCIKRELDLIVPEPTYEGPCEYPHLYSYHYFNVPLEISPHRSLYNIGDTIKISFNFPDSIYDFSFQRNFKIEGFPFKPVTGLYRLHGLPYLWESGFRVNDLLVDSIYNHNYGYQAGKSDYITAEAVYEDGYYKFEYEIVLLKEGDYILWFSDMYNEAFFQGNEEFNAEADAIEFDGKCDKLIYLIANTITGDDHLEQFESQVRFIDDKIFSDGLKSLDNRLESLGYGRKTVERDGFFGFEVQE